MSKLGASIDKYSKEVLRIKTEESSRWAKRFKESNRCLENLKEEIAEKNLSVALDIYLQKKNGDLEISKLMMKMAHVSKINNVYQTELENWCKIVLKASEIIQENFLILRSVGELDSEMQEKLQMLGKLLQGQRNVKFADDEQIISGPILASTGSNSDVHEIAGLQNMMNLTDCSGGDDVMISPLSAKKRINNNEMDESEGNSKKAKNSAADDYPFIKPKALKSINFDQPVSIPKIAIEKVTDMNTTFDLAGPGGSNVLGERFNKDPPRPSSSALTVKCKKYP